MDFDKETYISAIQNNFIDNNTDASLPKTNEVISCSILSGVNQTSEQINEHIELLYVMSSEASATINKQEYSLKSGDLLVIIPGDTRTISCPSNCRIISVQADINFLFSQILTNTDLHYSMPYLLSKFDNARLIKAETLDVTDIPKVMYDVVNEYFAKNNFYKLAIRADLSKVALFIFRRWDSLKEELVETEAKQDNAGYKRLANVLKEIDTRYMEDLTVSEMAELAGMSYSFFSRFFKATMKLTFSEYLNSVRIQQAERLLIESDLSVAEIGEAVGFANTSYFIAQFKRQLHITPKRYKSNYGM